MHSLAKRIEWVGTVRDCCLSVFFAVLSGPLLPRHRILPSQITVRVSNEFLQHRSKCVVVLILSMHLSSFAIILCTHVFYLYVYGYLCLHLYLYVYIIPFLACSIYVCTCYCICNKEVLFRRVALSRLVPEAGTP